MAERQICSDMLPDFKKFLLDTEKSTATIEKYLRDVRRFIRFAGGQIVDKQLVMRYKAELGRRYAIASANSMIASLNAFLRRMGWGDLCIRQFKVQRQAYTPEEKELTRAEYIRLVAAARHKGNWRLALILQTICATGIRVSELRDITVEALHHGEAIVRCKGKSRVVFIVPDLCRSLLVYAKQSGLTSGPVFVTRHGRPVGRTCIWRDMKALCAQAGVAPAKVFPHNLRHLFARTFYNMDKDIAKLADLLGHASINTTRIYIATTGAEHRKQMENMRLII